MKGAGRARDRGHAVVEREIVLGVDPRCHCRGRIRHRQDEVLGLAARQAERAHIDQPGIRAPLDCDRARLLTEVVDTKVSGPRLGAGPDDKRREADDLAGHADAVVLYGEGKAIGERAVERLDDPVAEQVAARLLTGPDHAGRERERR